MEYRQLNVSKYVGDALPDIVSEVRTGNNGILKAPPGLGKTDAMLEMRKHLVGKRMALVCPTRVLVDNIGDKVDRGDGRRMRDKVPCGYGSDFLRLHRRAQFIVTTWDSVRSMKEWEYPPELLIIDEAHQLISHSSFRDVVADILSMDVQKLFMSATPELIEDWHGITSKLEIIPTNPLKKNVNICQLGGRNPKTLIQDIIDSRTAFRYALNPEGFEEYVGQGNILMIRHNNKDKLREIYDSLPKETQRVTAMYHSDREELVQVFPGHITEGMAVGAIPEEIEIILITSIYDAGLTLEVKRHVDCWAITNNKEMMPHPIDMVQLMHRVRIESRFDMSLNIVGNFGNYTLEDIQAPEKASNEQRWLERAEGESEACRQLDELSYKGLLNSYEVRAHERRLPPKLPRQCAFDMRDIQIVSNLASWPEQYEEVEAHLSHAGRTEWAEYFNGRMLVGEPTAKVKHLSILVREAIKCDIHPSLYMDGHKFHKGRLENLVGAVSTFGNFRTVLGQLFSNGLKDVTMPLASYHDLPREHRKKLMEVARVFYPNAHFKPGRKSQNLKIRKDVDIVEGFCNSLLHGMDCIWQERKFTEEVV